MESVQHSVSEVKHGNDLCSMHKGLAHFDRLSAGTKLKTGEFLMFEGGMEPSA